MWNKVSNETFKKNIKNTKSVNLFISWYNNFVIIKYKHILFLHLNIQVFFYIATAATAAQTEWGKMHMEFVIMIALFVD